MKKRSMVLTLLAVVVMAGCGAKDGNATEAVTEAHMEAVEKADAIEAEVKDAANAPTEAAAEKEPEFKLYDRASGWDQLNIGDRAIQIDDVIYKPGMTVAEVVAAVESSEVEYEYEYEPERKLSKSDSVKLIVKRKGSEYFRAWGYNPREEKINEEETVIFGFLLSDQAKENCRFWDGRCLRDLYGLSYDEALKLADQFPGYDMKMTESEGKLPDGSAAHVVRITGSDYLFDMDVFYSNVWAAVNLYVGNSSGKVEDAKFITACESGPGAHAHSINDKEVRSVSELPEDKLEVCIKYLVDHYLVNYEYEDYKMIGYASHIGIEESEGKDPRLYRYLFFELTKADGTKSYVPGFYGQLKYDPETDKLDPFLWGAGDEYQSTEELINAYNLRVNTIDIKWY